MVDVIPLIVLLVIAGLLLWLVFNYIPMPQVIRMLILVVIVGVVCLWFLQAFGVGHIYVGRRP